jgi:hypothetical protein
LCLEPQYAIKAPECPVGAEKIFLLSSVTSYQLRCLFVRKARPFARIAKRRVCVFSHSSFPFWFAPGTPFPGFFCFLLKVRAVREVRGKIS